MTTRWAWTLAGGSFLASVLLSATAAVFLVQERQDLEFEIRHDGVGFDPADPTRSGMVNMRDRIKALGGTFEIRSDPGHATAVRGRVPLDGSPA